MSAVRAEFPPLPIRVAGLPVDRRGYPVPWFVAWLDSDGSPLPDGQGTPDFRIIGPGKVQDALRFQRCWICGGKLGRYVAYVIGPMCAVNRVSAEPPSHRDCAVFSATACPFLTRPHAHRREAGVPDGIVEAPGIALKRNPGVALVWVTEGVRYDEPYRLFDVGDPIETLWFAEGRAATRAEVLASIESGLPALRELAEVDDALGELEAMTSAALQLIPVVA